MVYESRGPGFLLVAASFSEWLRKRAVAARKRYRKEEWRKIVAGPRPFNNEELRIVEARKKFQWRKAGISENGNIIFEIHNGSDMVLPYFSVKVRNRAGTIGGGAWLPVGHILPGETKLVEKDCYKDLIPGDEIEVSDREEPEPEDRDRFWEFKPLKADPRE